MVADQFVVFSCVVMNRPYIRLHMAVTTCIIDGASGIDGFGDVIDIFCETYIVASLSAPRLVEGSPSDDAGMIAVANQDLCPF